MVAISGLETEIAFECAKRAAEARDHNSSFNILLLVPRIVLVQQNINRLIKYGYILGSFMNTLKAIPDASKATFFVKTEWNSKEEGGGGFCFRSSTKNFEIGGQSIQRNSSYITLFDFPPEFAGEGKGPTVCEACMSNLGVCITQTIVAHATARGINLDSIIIDLEGNIDLRGSTGISSDVRPGAQGFKVNVNIYSTMTWI